jgi:hypothetical protein
MVVLLGVETERINTNPACKAGQPPSSGAIQVLANNLDYLKVDTKWCKNEIRQIKDFVIQLQTGI